jgi:L-2,4-diaminobutyrate transaminase
MNIEDVDKNFVFHPFTNARDHAEHGPLTIVKGQGSTLTDTRGKEYLDAMAGLWCVNIGYGNAEMAESLRAAQLEVVLPLTQGRDTTTWLWLLMTP